VAAYKDADRDRVEVHFPRLALSRLCARLNRGGGDAPWHEFSELRHMQLVRAACTVMKGTQRSRAVLWLREGGGGCTQLLLEAGAQTAAVGPNATEAADHNEEPAQVRFPGDAKSSLGDAESSLDEVKSPLGEC
jgi:hypothetical protein